MNILNNPIIKARMIAKMSLPAILDRDKKKRAKTVLVPGSDGKTYQVVIKRHPKRANYLESITTLCQLQTGGGPLPCPGNNNGHICYHSFSAILFAAYEKDINTAICGSYEHAKHVANFKNKDAKIIHIKGSKKYYYLVIGGSNGK